MERISCKGVLYNRAVLIIGSVLVTLILSANLVVAQGRDTSDVPEPAPTDAVKASGRRFQVEGRVPIDRNVAASKYAALLKAYAEMLRYGLRQGLFPGSWGEEGQSLRFYRVDSDHPAPEVVSWLSRSKIIGDVSSKKERVVTLESPDLGSLTNNQPAMRATVVEDFDHDGLSDVVSVGYDGCVYIMKKVARGESKIVARSQSFASLELVSGPGYERVRFVLPQDLGAVEVLSNGQARVFLELEIMEMVNGRLLGRTTERREVLISAATRLDRIRFSLSEPPDFARLFQTEVEIRGTAISEKILENVDIRHNGTVAWESPDGIGIRALNFNLARDLVPGWNNFRITARDSEGFSQIREVWVEGPEGASRVRGQAGKRALLVSLDSKLDEERIRKSLALRGFPDASITVLEGDEVTATAVIEAIRQPQGAESLFFYCESVAEPGALIGGKQLVFSDRELSAIDLAQAFEAGGYTKVFGLFHTEMSRSQLARVGSHELWRDTATFLERIGGAGRVMVANLEDTDSGSRRDRKRFRKQFEKALVGPAASDLERFLDLEEPGETVFRGWMFGPPILR